MCTRVQSKAENVLSINPRWKLVESLDASVKEIRIKRFSFMLALSYAMAAFSISLDCWLTPSRCRLKRSNQENSNQKCRETTNVFEWHNRKNFRSATPWSRGLCGSYLSPAGTRTTSRLPSPRSRPRFSCKKSLFSLQWLFYL